MYKLESEKTFKEKNIKGQEVIVTVRKEVDSKTGAIKTITKRKTFERIGNPDLGQCLFTREDTIKGMATKIGYCGLK